MKFISIITGLINSLLIVRIFGASSDVDAYFISISAIFVFISLIQGGQLSEVFLPKYLELKINHSNEVAHRALFIILHKILIGCVFISSILLLTAPYFIKFMAAGLPESSKLLSITIFRLSLFLVFTTVINSFINIVLNAEKIYGRAELTGLFNSISSIIILLFFHDLFGIYTLVLMLFFGKVIELISGIIFLRKAGIFYKFILKGNGHEDINFFKHLKFTTSYVFCTQIYIIILNYSASFLPEGSLSIFNYTKQISTKVQMVFIRPFMNIYFSEFKHSLLKKKLTSLII